MAFITERPAFEGAAFRVAFDDLSLADRVAAHAQASGRPVRPLHLQTLLQAARLADSSGFVSSRDLEELLVELAEEIPSAEEWVIPSAIESPHQLRFDGVDSDSAARITRRFHYLRSPRQDGRAYGLFAQNGSVAALCVVSPLDVPHLEQLLRGKGRSTLGAQVLSRVFAFEGAPKNSISYLLSRVAHEEWRHGATDLVTYVNPNLGFTGVSYCASGWSLLGDEPGTCYRYLDRRYMTDRELARQYGKRSDSEYRCMLGRRFAVSELPLDPLLIFHRAI